MKIGNTIYFDHQATTPVDSRVVEAMSPYLGTTFGNPHSADHVLGWAAAQAVNDSATRIAALIGADPDEIIFTSGATEANNLALIGVGRRAIGGKRRRILCSAIEHKCVLAAGRALQNGFGYQVELLPVDQQGHVIISALKDALDDDVLLVSIMAVNNEIGTVQKMEEISQIVDSVGAMLHSDAAQAPSAINLKSLGRMVSMASLSAHKMYGPKGIGVLFARREIHERIEPLIYGGGQQKNLRSGTVPVGLCVGMAAAADLMNGADKEKERDVLQRLRNRFVDGVGQLPWPVKLNGPVGSDRHPGNANIQFEGFSASDILAVLQPRVAASTGSACTSGIPEPSHVLRAIGLSDDAASASIRFSFGRHTTERDIDDAISLIAQSLSKLAGVGLARTA